MASRYAQVVIDAPLPQPLLYRCEDPIDVRGRLCVVPLGRREVVGVLVGLVDQADLPPERIKPVRRVLDEIEPLPTHWLELTRFAAEYYQRAWGEVAVPALPPVLRNTPGPRFAQSLARLRKPVAPAATDECAAPALNAQQLHAVESIEQAAGFAPFLLYGVTGSGKTEVYLNAIARLRARDPAAQALVLVPEINLTPQFEARLRARFPATTLVSLHSGLPAAERTAAWLAAHEARAHIVLGTRLAVFASVPRLGLIVVDEEHDGSFKAGDGARYSARDLAVKRAHMAGVPIVLGSATPVLETWRHAQAGRYRRLDLPQRAGQGAAHVLPRVERIDTRTFPLQHGFSAPLTTALRETLARGEQALVYINRRGYAPVIACDACGWLSTCKRCAVFAAFHKVDGTLRCHHCGWQVRVPRACPTCGNTALDAVGHGTQRVEETLRALLPAARIARIDRDTTQRRHAARVALDAVHAGEVDVLVGTQMIAKGHDFRRVSLVGVLNADAQLVAHDFRAPERLFATLLQVAGRAGRSGLPSRVLIQTRFPAHPLFEALARFDFAAFAAQQLRERRAAGMPPFAYHALLTAEAKTLAAALEFLQHARTLGVQAGETPARTSGAEHHPVTLYDPVPMPLARLAGVHRAQLLVESAHRAALQAFLPHWLQQLRDGGRAPGGGRVRWQIEVDPPSI
ncbi:MAG TPA: primosomal protein N' [Burkholderiaceae bacterium]|nr:primosomal protein N' [Burkholderiaceae bacterium]